MKVKTLTLFVVVSVSIIIVTSIIIFLQYAKEPSTLLPEQPKPQPKLVISGTITEGPISEPVQIVLDFYQAIAEKNCAKAIQLRPGYTEHSCLNIQNVVIKRVILVRETTNISVVYLDITYQQAQKEQSFFGHVKLVKPNDKWFIDDDSYASAEKLNLKQYLKKHKIPDMVHGYEPPQLFSGLTFGSSTLLNSCWTPAELDGSPKDKKVRRPIKNPYREPPLVTTPYNFNQAVEPKLRNSIRYVTPAHNQKIVALTFDLCERTKERTGYDAAIVNYLREHGIKATFYAGGKWMHSHPEKTMQLMADPLFEIGNHAWTHGNMRVLKGEKMENQILWTQGQYEVLHGILMSKLETGQCPVPVTEMEKIPPIPMTFRFPYGTCSRESLQALAKYGLPAIQWNVVTADPSRKQSSKAIAKTVLRKVKPGSIIIAHANGRGYNTAKALPLFIPKLKKLDYQFVTVSELLKSGKVVTTDTCYELKPGDNKRYDRIFGKGTE